MSQLLSSCRKEEDLKDFDQVLQRAKEAERSCEISNLGASSGEHPIRLVLMPIAAAGL